MGESRAQMRSRPENDNGEALPWVGLVMAGNKTRIMYIELKSGHNDAGPARIGRVSFSHTGRTIYYKGKALRRGSGIGGNYFDVATGEGYWVSGPKKDGGDRHWAGSGPVEIDSDVAAEYWREIRQCEMPDDGKVV